MPCKNNNCEYNPTTNRALPYTQTPEEIKYAKLWAEIELPKLLQDATDEKPTTHQNQKTTNKHQQQNKHKQM